MTYQQVFDHESVLRIMLMSMCSRSDIKKSKSDLGFRSGISVKSRVNVSVHMRYQQVLDHVSVL